MTPVDEFRLRLETYLAERVQAPVHIRAARQLTSGASRQADEICLS
jgi:hypothetical protein